MVEDCFAAKLDLAFAFSPIGIIFFDWDDLTRLEIGESGLDAWEWPADAAVDAVCAVEAAANRHADFGHAKAFEEDVTVAEVCPGALGWSWESGRAGDVQSEVLWGDSFLCGLLKLWI